MMCYGSKITTFLSLSNIVCSYKCILCYYLNLQFLNQIKLEKFIAFMRTANYNFKTIFQLDICQNK